MYLLTEVPSAPSIPEVHDVYANSLKLTWQPPSNDGGTQILGYHIEKRTSTAKRWSFVNKEPLIDPYYHLTDLYEGMEYEFRVSAENKMGSGPPSEPCLPVLAKDPWRKYADVMLKDVE